MLRLTTLILAAIIPFLSFGTSQAATPTYHITEIGALGGFSSVGTALNDQGHVVGTIYTPTGTRAFFFDGTQQILEMSEGGTRSEARDINNSGVIVGQVASYNDDNSLNWWRAFRYDGTMQELSMTPGIEAAAINTQGQVTGTQSYLVNDGSFLASDVFLFDGTMHDLGRVGYDFPTTAYAINDFGQIAGHYSDLGNYYSHAFLYDGTFHDLGTLGGSRSYANDINDQGHVVGYSHLADESPHVYLYDGTMHDLGFAGSAEEINNKGQIVGSAAGLGAFVYDAVNGLVSLNSLIDPVLGWNLYSASDINEHGQITGVGLIDGKARAFLLTPVPEPSGAMLCAAAMLGALPFSRRRSRRESRHRPRANAADLALAFKIIRPPLSKIRGRDSG